MFLLEEDRELGLRLYEYEEPLDISEQSEGYRVTIEYRMERDDLDSFVYVFFEQPEEDSDYTEVFLGHTLGDTGLIVPLPDQDTYTVLMNFFIESVDEG